jgi:hypothetical protein
LFFSIDIEIKYKIEEYIDKKFKEFEDEEVKKLLLKSSFDLNSLQDAGSPNQRVYDTSFHNIYRNDILGGVVSGLGGIGSGIGIGTLNSVVTAGIVENAQTNVARTTAPAWTEASESSMFAQNINNNIRVTESNTEKELRSQIRSIKKDTFNPVYTRYVDDIAISYDLNSLLRAFSFRGIGINLDISKFFIGMDLIKAVESVLNSKEFFIKYDKTKVYSYKMDKEYLGYVYAGSVIPSRFRDSVIHSIRRSEEL